MTVGVTVVQQSPLEGFLRYPPISPAYLASALHGATFFPPVGSHPYYLQVYPDVLLGLSFMNLSSGLSFCRMRRTSYTMGGFFLLYLLMILLMRSGDVETNPGPDRIVSEKEFLKLSKLIEPNYYKDVGINLDISIAELGQIKERSQNTSDALMIVFTRWRDKQPPDTDIRAVLAEELESSGLGSLSGKLLVGSLVLKRTGEKKKESYVGCPQDGLYCH
eukprot:XP_011667480.1 PREDICTED: uncharacterized protein LOC105439790 [Strongylocentrotus purpuratus]